MAVSNITVLFGRMDILVLWQGGGLTKVKMAMSSQGRLSSEMLESCQMGTYIQTHSH
jgi:hypothetical protein